MDNNFQLDPEKSWSKIEPQLEQHFREKRKRRFVWLFFFGLFIVVSGGIAYYTTTPEAVKKMEVIQEETQPFALPATAAREKSTVKSSANILVTTPQAALSIPARSADPIIRDRKASTKKAVATAANGSSASRVEHENIDNDQVVTSTSLPIPPLASVTLEPVIAPAVALTDQVQKEVQATKTDAGEAEVSENKSASESAAADSTRSTTTVVDSIAPTATLVTSTDTFTTKIIPLLLHPERKWYVGVYGGAFQVSKSLQAPYSDWVDRRLDEEDNSLGNAWGISVATSRSSWTFGAGFEYARYGEQTRYSPFSYQEVTQDSLLWSYLYDATDTFYVSGNQIFLRDLTPNLIDSNSTTVTDTVVQFTTDGSIAARNGKVYCSYVEIPISVGYAWRKGKWNFGIQGAVVPALLQRSSGYYLSTDETGVLAADRIAAVSRFVIGARLGLSFEYAINNRWMLHVDPQWRRQLTSVYGDENIDQRYTAIGATMGVRVLLK